MRSAELSIDTADRRLVDLNKYIVEFCRALGDGLLNLFVPHATAGIAVFELGAGTEDDLDELLERLLPRDDRYVHKHGSKGHGADHLLPVLISPSLTLPVLDGRLTLGTWQHVVLVDFNEDNPSRKVRMTFLPGEARAELKY